MPKLEYVPTTIPTTRAKEKARNTCPPIRNKTSTVRKVSPLVKNRPRKRLIDRLVHHVGERFAPHQAVVLANPIEDHDGIVHRISDQCQQRRNHRQRNFKMQQRQKSYGDQNVVKYRKDGGCPVNPLESEGNIYQHARQSIEGNQNRLRAAARRPLSGPTISTLRMANAPSVKLSFTAPRTGGVAPSTLRKIVEIGQHAVLVAVAIIQNFLGELRIAIPGIRSSKAEDLAA